LVETSADPTPVWRKGKCNGLKIRRYAREKLLVAIFRPCFDETARATACVSNMPKPALPQSKINKLERENVMLRQRILRLQRNLQ
jgi:hypothetical protein